MPSQTKKQRDYPITSVTRLSTYVQCGELYRLKYVEKQAAPETFNPAFVIGRYVHSVLEEVLDPKTQTRSTDEAFTLQLPAFLKDFGMEEVDEEFVLTVATTLGNLLYKASARYCAPDAIRTQKGDVPYNVIDHPPSSWTSAYRQANIADKRLRLDNIAANVNPVFIQHPFSYLIADIYSLVTQFRCPDWAVTQQVELAFSTDKSDRVLFPGEDKLSLNAYIDWVIRLKDSDALVLLDHKTDASAPTGLDVQHHTQLNIYARAYELVYGERPAGIGIHHVPSGKIVMAELDPKVQQSIIDYLVSIQAQIKAERFLKRHPLEFDSPCMRRDWKTKEVKSVCPYFGQCWDTYSQCLN